MISRVGFLAPTGMFISLTQSDADEQSLVRSIDADVVPTGTQDVERRDVDRLRGRRRFAAGVDDAADGADGARADRGDRTRGYGRVPYAGGGDAVAVASARQLGAPDALTQIRCRRRAAPEADLTGWAAAPFTAAGFTYDVYRKGEGPGVVLIPEMPGLHPGVLALGNHLVDNGFTVAAPSLFGTPGAPGMRPGAVPVMLKGCVAKEFAAFATNADRPDRPLPARAGPRPQRAHARQGRRRHRRVLDAAASRLAAAVDDSVLAPVLSQPSLPIGLTAKQKADPGLSEAELKIVERRVADEGLCALGLRFSEDPLSPGARFTTLKARLGDAFEVIEIDSKKGNEHGFGKMAHSVLTLEVREVDGHPAYEARKRVVEFLTERLTSAA